jgi:type IV secretion system protein VirD4
MQNRPNNKNDTKIYVIFCALPVIWLALKAAPVIFRQENILTAVTVAANNPLSFEYCVITPHVVAGALLVYALVCGIWLSNTKNYRRGEEHGSAKWGQPGEICKKYRNAKFENNKILSQNFILGNTYRDAKRHQRNLNTLIVGGSGAGKTYRYIKPNVLQGNSSMVILDPKGEILRDTGHMLKEKGFDLKVIDLINLERSDHYNPFRYLRDENDVQRLVTNLFKATTPKGSSSNDPFWDTSASMLLMSLILYTMYMLPEKDQCFATIMSLLLEADVVEDQPNYKSPVDLMMDEIAAKDLNHIILKYWRGYRSGSAKTLKSIQITLASKLEKFNLIALAELTRDDDLNLSNLGEKKTALFALIPDNDTSFNFLVSILYTQLFQQLFHSADFVHGGALPVPVHFLMDEFANVSLPDDFEKILSVMRSRGVYVSIVLQNLAQLKALFEKQWESIIGNCDEFLFLGGNEKETHKYVSELLGKATIDTQHYNKTGGKSGHVTQNYQNAGRELMLPDEVRKMDTIYAVLFIRGEDPILDKKVDIRQHPHYKMLADGGSPVYEHGRRDSPDALNAFQKTVKEPTLKFMADPEDEDNIYAAIIDTQHWKLFSNMETTYNNEKVDFEYESIEEFGGSYDSEYDAGEY